MTTARSLTYLMEIAGLVEWDIQCKDGKLRLTCVVNRESKSTKHGLLISGVGPVSVCAYLQLAVTAMREHLDGDSDISSENWSKVIAGINEHRRSSGLAELNLGCQVIADAEAPV